ncbi:MAG: LpxL/LpxP family Kdo(2)-lipid IV(A) lauroyl/palmitoleoyl acyltransferase [Gammaproteobacteria bacterium]|nr:LpxL/LpxP family Kdo(2)-lipid IV(A) lauroyl/palmitoleoyl acyltransferase [Gammaproteobacteria bacterium]
MSNDSSNTRELSFTAPRFWPLWVLFGFLYLITRLPLAVQQKIGRVTGWFFYHLGPRRRHIATVNIQLCFPELSEGQQQALIKQHYELFGLSLIETFAVWWSDPDLFTGRVTYEGLENLSGALKKGNGVLLLSGHFTTLEMARPLLGEKIPFDMVYRPHKNPLYEHIMSNGRQRWKGKSIDRRNVREMLRRLKSNHAVWYGPDQDYGRKHSVFVPFMGVMAATVTGTSRLAKISGAPVVPYVIRRTENNGYHVRVFPELTDFPTDDAEQDATRINQWFEEQIRQQPEDYLWTHRRFKTPPAGQDRPY